VTFTRGLLLVGCIGAWVSVVLVLIACSASRTREPAAPGPSRRPERAAKHAHGSGAHAHGSGAHADHAGHDAHGTYANAEQWSKRLDDSARDAWQRPDEVVRALALTPAMTVADVGAGTGYFAVRLARAVPQGAVIATDIEPDMVRYLEERARREQLGNLRAVRAFQDRSGLAPDSVDAILIVHVWHHLGGRDAYARDLAAALRPGGRLLVVDFSPTAHRGPPGHMRLAPAAIVAELAAAGLVARVSPVELPDQYVVEAIKPARAAP
jgi:arsenite methyltransferase